jgi:hypothetical protein
MKGLGEGIAFAGLAIAAAWLEIAGKTTGGLWAVVVLWWMFTDWGQKKGE